jgi:DNA-binding NarL/FixJ family response regulator
MQDVMSEVNVASCNGGSLTNEAHCHHRSRLAGALFALLVVEQMRTDEPFDALSLAVDIVEMLLLASAVLLTAVFSVQTREMRNERQEMLRDLRDARADSARWRATARSHIDGLSSAIAKQFDVWGLTDAEADVAGLLLKGMAHKEIALLRGSSEATVRQHAAAVYRKSGLTSRAQLTAFFLEDLLAPSENADHRDRLRVVKDES